MDYFNNLQNRDGLYQEDFNLGYNGFDLEKKIDKFTFQQIEFFIQQQVSLIITISMEFTFQRSYSSTCP
jgi:hypothetical protein